MTIENFKALLDTCFIAKKTIETLPQLPKGMKPRHIHVMDAISSFENENKRCKIGDICSYLNLTMPSITLLLQQLEKLELVKKEKDINDRRFSYLTLTEKGKDCVIRYATTFHNTWNERLSDITDEDAEKTIAVINALSNTMPGIK